MHPALRYEFAQTVKIFDILGQIRSFIGFERHGMMAETVVIEEQTKAFQANLALADMLVPVNPAAAPFLGIIEMEEMDAVAANVPLQLGEGLHIPGSGAEVIPGGKDVAGIDADAELFSIAAVFEQPAQLLEAATQ